MPSPQPLQTFSSEAQELIRRRLAGVAATPDSKASQAWAVRPELVPLSPDQRRLWFLGELRPSRADYNVATAWRLRGPLRTTELDTVLTELVSLHDQLRVVVVVDGGEPYQRVTLPPASVLAEHDLSGDDDRERAALALARERSAAPFNLEAGPLYRFWIARLAPDDHIFGIVVHHIVVDRESLAVLLEDLVARYGRDGERIATPPPPGGYADYAAAQHRLPRGGASPHWEFWRGQLDGVTGILDLPTDRDRPNRMLSGDAGEAIATVSPAVAVAVRTLADICATTPFVVCLAALEALLFRYTGATSFTVGCPFSARDRRELERVVGFFVRSLPLVASRQSASDSTFRQLVEDARETMLGAHEHQAIPLEDLVSLVDGPRDTSYNPLFQVWFDYAASDPAVVTWASPLAAELVDCGDHRARFDLEMHITEASDELRVRLLYARELFDAETAEDVIRHYGRLLAAAVCAPETTLSRLPLLGQDEIDVIVNDWAGDGVGS